MLHRANVEDTVNRAYDYIGVYSREGYLMARDICSGVGIFRPFMAI